MGRTGRILVSHHHQRRWRMTLASASLALISILNTACSAPEKEQPGMRLSSEDVKAQGEREADLGHIESSELLKDGVVDKADYESAFENLRRCMREAGYKVSDPILSPVDNLAYVFEYDAAGRKSEGMRKDSSLCEEEYWSNVSAVYMNTNEQKMDEPIRSAAISCLQQKGYDVPESARSYLEMYGDPLSDEGKQRQDTATCVLETAYRLHPHIKSLGLYG